MGGSIPKASSSVPNSQGVQTAYQDGLSPTDTARTDQAASPPPPQEPPQDPKAAAKTSQAAREHATESKMQAGARSAVVQRDLQAQVPQQAGVDRTGLKPGEQISARVTDKSDILNPVVERTFDFSRPVTKEQAAAIIFQNGQVPDGAKLVQGEGNKWVLQFRNNLDERQNMANHGNAHMETVRTRERAPNEMFFPEPELTMTWTGGKLNTKSTGPKRSDLSGEYGFKITKRYPLDEGQSPDMNVRRLVQPGPGYEIAFEKPMTRDQVMDKLFQKDKLQKDQVRLIPVPHEPTATWQVQLLDSQAPLTREAGDAIGASNVYGKESVAPGMPAGIKAHIENQTVPPNAKRFPPDVYVWEQEGHIVRVETNGKKGTDGYYKYEETKLHPNNKQINDTMRWLMMEKGMPVRQAWQEFDRHWDEINIGMLGMVGAAASMRVPNLHGGATIRTPIREPRGRFGGSEPPPVPHEPVVKTSTAPHEPAVVKNAGSSHESPPVKTATPAPEPTVAKTEAKPAPKRTTVREDEEAAAAKTVKVSHRDDPDGPKSERISDGNKQELQNSGWLKRRLPSEKDRRDFMKWLQKGHTADDHEHLRPGSPDAEEILKEWSDETGRRLE